MVMVRGNLVNILQKKIYPVEITISEGKIAAIDPLIEGEITGRYIMPGFVDAHVHIESSMLIPASFARLAVVHGTVATVSDPHEIANVCGIEGVEFMIENGNTVPFKFNFGAPSCVPATIFETAGAALDSTAVTLLMQRPEIRYLSEMMNFPGVLHGDAEVLAKIAAAKSAGKPVDGHAPGLRGEEAGSYIAAGMSTDHECFTAGEALDKLGFGMKILVREGSAAKNFEALIGLVPDHFDMMMFCSDDKHPDSLVDGHINQLCARAVAKGIDIFKVLQVACMNPVKHYNLPVGLLNIGDPADFIVTENLVHFKVRETYIDGALVASDGKSLIVPHDPAAVLPVNSFDCAFTTAESFAVRFHGQLMMPVIGALDGQLITEKLQRAPRVVDGLVVSDVANDILKIVVVNRYNAAPVAVSFIHNVGLKQGAIASSVAHDSHNIVAVGVDDEHLAKAVNMIIATRGGVSCVKDNLEMIVPLPVGGLMSVDDGYHVAAQYSLIDKAAKDAGSTLSSPFMTLSFMALLVIPHLKLSDKGLFDGDSFSFTPLI